MIELSEITVERFCSYMRDIHEFTVKVFDEGWGIKFSSPKEEDWGVPYIELCGPVCEWDIPYRISMVAECIVDWKICPKQEFINRLLDYEKYCRKEQELWDMVRKMDAKLDILLERKDDVTYR